MPSIFLSYARSDDEPFAHRLHADLTAAKFDVWFDRVSMPSRSLTFHQEIRDAVASRDRLILIVGPKAHESLYVRQEWQFAYFEAEKIVSPILRLGDYPIVPDELKLLHCEDFRDDSQYELHLKNLIRQLSEPAPALGKLIGVPSLPPHFLSRTERLTALRDALRADLDRPVVITGAAARVGMHGMGGIGKSVLAATLSRDRKIREAFPDGIVWVGLGPLPTVADLQRRVHKDLGGDGAFQTEHEGRVKLRDILKDKSVLLILDDVWRRADVDWFDILGPRCRAMITTRDRGLLTSVGGDQSTHYQVELLTDAEALNLLAQAAGVELDKLPSEAADLIAECGRLPLAVALCGGMVKSGISWHDVLDALREHELEFISDEHRTESQHANLWRTMEVSVRMLGERANDEPLLKDAALRFSELSVFPTDEPIPEATVVTLWTYTGGLSERHARKLLILLQQRSLLELTRKANFGTTVALHDLLHDFAVRLSKRDIGDEVALHQRLLEAYCKKCPDGWHVDPPKDGYFFTHLRHHLIEAGRAGELADLLHELRWLEAKNEVGLTFDLTADFRATLDVLPEDDARFRIVQMLDKALRSEIDFIERHAKDFPQALIQSLWNSTQPLANSNSLYPNESSAQQTIKGFIQTYKSEKERLASFFVWTRLVLSSRFSLSDQAEIVFKGHEAGVNALTISEDGQWIGSSSYDKTVRIRNARSAEEGVRWKWENAFPGCVAFVPKRRAIAVCVSDRHLKRPLSEIQFIDIESSNSTCQYQIEGIIHSIALSPDEQYLAAGTSTGHVRIWDLGTNKQLSSLFANIGEIHQVAFSPDSKLIVTASGGVDSEDESDWYISDCCVRLWDWRSHQLLWEIEKEEGEFTSVAFSPNGCRIICGYSSNYGDGSVMLIDATTRKLLAEKSTLSQVQCVTWAKIETEDFALAGCGYSINEPPDILVLSSQSLIEMGRFVGHSDNVTSIVTIPASNAVVSSSSDGTLRQWDVSSYSQTCNKNVHIRDITDCCFSPAANVLLSLSHDGKATAWETATGAILWDRKNLSSPRQVLFSPNGDLFAIRESHTIILLEWPPIQGRSELRFWLGPRASPAMSFSLDGRYFVYASNDVFLESTIVMFDLANRTEAARWRAFEVQPIFQLLFSSGSILLAARAFESPIVRIWDFVTHQLKTELRGHKHDVISMAFAPSKDRIATGDRGGELRLWNSRTGKCFAKLQGHHRAIIGLKYTACGRRIVSTDGEKTIVWDVQRRKKLLEYEGWCDVEDYARNSVESPWFALSIGNDSYIGTKGIYQNIACFPGTYHHGRSDLRMWAGFHGNQLYLYKLEGNRIGELELMACVRAITEPAQGAEMQ